MHFLRKRLGFLAVPLCLAALSGCPRTTSPDAGPDAADVPRLDVPAADVPDDLRADGAAPDANDGGPPADSADAPTAPDAAPMDAADASDGGIDAPGLDDVAADTGGDDAFDATADTRDGHEFDDVVLWTDAGCGATYARHEILPAFHIPPDASAVWNSNPPSSGDHTYEWARWGVHAEVVPRLNWLHNLEHGGVAVLYRCDGDCTATRAALAAFVRALPTEPGCTDMDAGLSRRVVLTEDPLIDTPVAAAAWAWTYHASCVDPDSLQAFVLARTGHAPEDFCYEGSFPP